ncbi:Uncharacterised protein [Streptococcus pneumoniae]|uniref:Uncharacterized protein n=1 Tax=Streptococcus pneumoniae TaxID=1313 RepID=A0A4J1XG00_STREE|nr:Uncharacterised protein [Streptococcus pneumoniae]CIS90077.1 Uncharacterised protein [Streptococcus pneumoniae]CIT55695.1 Uncharacterised protein [Streptococcus pneumoniae]CIV43337.1 Uncharacterised protein [Streptococcus pneumoniae]CIW24173.1 Uncharacterised protein [Streptococcus pneumoniae]
MYNLFAFAIGVRLLAFSFLLLAFMEEIIYLPNWNDDKPSSCGKLPL